MNDRLIRIVANIALAIATAYMYDALTRNVMHDSVSWQGKYIQSFLFTPLTSGVLIEKKNYNLYSMMETNIPSFFSLSIR